MSGLNSKGQWTGFGTGLGKYLKGVAKYNTDIKNKSRLRKAVTQGKYKVTVTPKQAKEFNAELKKWKKKYKKGSYKPITSSSNKSKSNTKAQTKTNKKSTKVSQKKKTVKKASAKKKTTKTNKKPNTKTKKKTSATTSKNNKKGTTVKQVVSQSPIYNITNNYNIVNNYYGTMGEPLNKTYSYSGTDLWKVYGEYITWKYYMTWKDQQDTK